MRIEQEAGWKSQGWRTRPLAGLLKTQSWKQPHQEVVHQACQTQRLRWAK